jgi:hypothetical protein
MEFIFNVLDLRAIDGFNKEEFGALIDSFCAL